MGVDAVDWDDVCFSASCSPRSKELFSCAEDCECPCFELVGDFCLVEVRIHSKDPCKLALVPPIFVPRVRESPPLLHS